MPDDDNPTSDPKVKQLLERAPGQPLEDVVDAATAAELERWFGLPSFQEVAEGAKPAASGDPDLLAVRERRDKAIAAVDPAFLSWCLGRTAGNQDLIKFRSTITLRIDPSVAMFDHVLDDRDFTMGEPREREVPEDIQDDLKDSAEQALLRDLHRPVLEFEKMFEVIDMSQRMDVVADVAEAMATPLRLPPLGRSPYHEAADVLAELRSDRERPWPSMFAAKPLPNRRVDE
jgi:hypothetical protein